MNIAFYGRLEPIDNHEYLLNVLFNKYKNIVCDYIPLEKLPTKEYEVVVYSSADPTKKNHFGYAPSYEQIKNFVILAKPKIIIQLSDECSNEQQEIHNLLSNYCNLLLRHHRHGSQLYTYNNRVEAIPLGYLNGFKYLNNIKPPHKRKYNWTWCGQLKADRREMINEFWSIWNNVVVANAKLSTGEVSELYRDSIFLPCGRGNFSLDCWRIYEGVISGAIPVIVGEMQEIQDTFTFFGELPPFIFSDSWRQAVQQCQQIQSNDGYLLQLQTDIITWWLKIMHKIATRIDSALVEDPKPLELAVFEKFIKQPQSVVYYY